MAISNIALFAAFLPAVFAMPQHAHKGHALHKARQLPSGLSTGFPQPSGVPGTAPFPIGGNSTVAGPTGTGGAGAGPVTIQSTINIVPLPASASAGEIGSFPSSAAGGIGNSPASGSSPSGAPGSGPGEGGASCGSGPSTVTITQANTVTVTVPAPSGGSGGAPSGAPIQSSPAAPASVLAPSSAPFPIGNSSVPAGPTGTGSAASTDSPSVPSEAPIVSSTPASSTLVIEQSSSAPVAANSAPVEAYSAPVTANSASVEAYSAPVAANSASVEAYSAPVTANSASVEAYSAPVAANSASVTAYSAPAQAAESAESSTAPSTPDVVAPVLLAAPVDKHPASVTPSATPVVASSMTPASSSAAVASSAAPAHSNGKARGLLYGGNNGQLSPAQALSAANTYLSASGGAVGWCWNWDSSPSPAIGWTTGTTDVDFVPMLWGLGDHVPLWEKNVAAIKPSYVMGFNEPDMTTDKGGCGMSVGDAVTGWKDKMEPLKSSGIKLVSPGTTNELSAPNMGHGYMSQFLDACTGCHFDALAFHYYGSASDVEALKATVEKYQTLQKQHNIAELWITEMAPVEAPTAEQMDAFLKFLDDPSSGVSRYAFNGLNTGNGQSLTGPVMQAAYQA